jgi:amyloid beta precursor protein binding protein 1
MAARTEHDNKFDRQMRLWGGHGQKKLEFAHILCFGSGPTASECLKNLVLPNVGQFTVVDDAKVTEADTGNNFFVDTEQIGRNRSEVVTEFLLEMNPEVRGSAVVKSPAEVAASDPAFFKQFSVVIAACQDQATVLKLGSSCASAGVPFIVARSYGLLGYVRLQLAEHRIIESHYDNDRYDLYIHPKQLEHFPELLAYCMKFNYEDAGLDSMKHAHVPYPAILVKEMRKWVDEHKSVPTTYEEKTAFKAQVKNMRRPPAQVGGPEEENFEEAVKSAFRAYDLPTLDHFTQRVLDDPQAKNITKDSNSFWVLCAALNRFIAKEGHGFMVPASNNIPDMTSETDSYLDLKAIFKARVKGDFDAFFAHAQAVLKEAGQPVSAISEADADMFCRNVRGLRVLRTRSLSEEHSAEGFNKEGVVELLEEFVEPDPDAEVEVPHYIHWYFALRAVDLFQQKNKRYPGVGGKSPERDAEELYEIQTELAQELKLSELETKPECLQEIARWGATEIHNIAAFVGGVGAQAALKVILQQYVPLNNTLIFNGISGGCKSMEL